MNSTTSEPHDKSQPPLSELSERGIYRIHSRNLTLGVYDGKGGFIGIREKFGALFLFREYAWETGPPYGTVQIKDRELVGWCPPEVELRETLGTKCAGCSERVNFNGEVMQWVGCRCVGSTRATAIPNHKLFSLLGSLATPEEQESWETQARVWSRRAAVPRSSTRGGTPSTQAGEGVGEAPPDS